VEVTIGRVPHGCASCGNALELGDVGVLPDPRLIVEVGWAAKFICKTAPQDGELLGHLVSTRVHNDNAGGLQQFS
jgi:hypothetical protein